MWSDVVMTDCNECISMQSDTECGSIHSSMYVFVPLKSPCCQSITLGEFEGSSKDELEEDDEEEEKEEEMEEDEEVSFRRLTTLPRLSTVSTSSSSASPLPVLVLLLLLLALPLAMDLVAEFMRDGATADSSDCSFASLSSEF
jgi:hypothetical protein